jgi:ERCC4-type nuclease
MIIKVDSREHSLLLQITKLKGIMPVFKNITIQIETLPIGDIIICDGKTEKLIIERKTAADLLSSIKDGRYDEQSYRLDGLEHHNHNIIYLIEGEMSRFNQFKSDGNTFIINEKLTFYSAMFSLNYYKGFSVFRSASLDETALIICNMAYKLEKELSSKKAFYNYTTLEGNNELQYIYNEGFLEGQEGQELKELTHKKEYVNVVKKVKKDNITPENIGTIMLSQIPGVSSVTALAIMEKYKTIANLIKEIELNKECLKDITSTNVKGQKRKINKTSIANIIKFLNKLDV